MKRISLTIATIVIFQIIVLSQPCLPDGITFTTQEEIDNFQNNFPDCTEIEGEVTIKGDDINNLDGLNVLTAIGGNFWISFNDNLMNLSGMDSLNSIDGSFYIEDNDSLISLTGLNNLNSIGSQFHIFQNDALKNLIGLNNIFFIGSNVGIHSNSSLTSLLGFPETITSIEGELYIVSNDSLNSLAELNNLTSISGLLSIKRNNALTSLHGLENLTFLGGLSFDENYLVTNLSAFSNLTSINGSLSIKNNDAISNLSGLDNINYVGGKLIIEQCNSLISMIGLNDLDSIEYDLQIGNAYNLSGSGNQSLTSLSGLENLKFIGRNVWIHENVALTSLHGLENITNIENDLEIVKNNALTSLIGIHNVISIGGDLKIWVNETLANCEIDCICDYIINPTGSVWISYNDSGCNSAEEIQEACGLSVNELGLKIGFTVSPNPFSSTTVISYYLLQNETATIEIQNISGQVIETIVPENDSYKVEFVYDGKELQTGVYFCVLRTKQSVVIQKMVKTNVY